MKKFFPIVLFVLVFSIMTFVQLFFDFIQPSMSSIKNDKGLNLDEKRVNSWINLKNQFHNENSLELKDKFNLESEKITLLNFWATWCGPCIYEMESLKKLHNSKIGKNINIVLVNIDDNDNLDQVKKFLKKNKINFLVIYDTNKELIKKFQITAVPTTMLFKNNQILESIDKAEDFNSEHWYKKFSFYQNNIH